LQSLVDVGVPDPKRRLKQYPFELSGGMRQRIMIAMALSCNPKLIIADEPTTALDVTIQRQILELIKNVQERTVTARRLIPHGPHAALTAVRPPLRGPPRRVRGPGTEEIRGRPVATDGAAAAGPAAPTAPAAGPRPGSADERNGEALVEVRDLKTYYPIKAGI